MTVVDPNKVAALETPLGVAFMRLLEDDTFAAQVIESPDAISSEYGLEAEDIEALVSDAHAVEGEVAGFAFGRSPTIGGLDFGGLLTPGRLGTSGGFSYTCCLTMINH